jgi:hypothetical protein
MSSLMRNRYDLPFFPPNLMLVIFAIGILLSEMSWETQRSVESIMTLMNSLQQWNRCPEFIDIGDRFQSVRLHKRHDLYALRGSISKQLSADVEMRLTGDDISILRGTPPADAASTLELLPVYAASGNSTPAVATGRIFIRLDEGASMETVRDDIEALEFRIDEVVMHAPHCAWLEQESGRIDEALSRLGRLRALPLAANVEPQLLRPRSWKGRA